MSYGKVPVKKRGFMRTLRESLPARLQYMIARAVPFGVRDWVVERAYDGGIDWDRTLGFVLLSGGESYIRYNLAGREAKGVLERESEQQTLY